MGGRTNNLRTRHWADFAATLDLPQRAARRLDTLALKAAIAVDLASLPFGGFPLNHAQRELRLRRQVEAVAG
ncbi:HipA N-terminal domain-containing protein [Arthrobacter crystallopoietes BAB-32]|uniref:HipA N-terminal domain-containing protein n=1 Tax=Arthrobacter crystallopoietes BAB-32 TaxID=1246476 RepID=N1V1K0_9MICC|nr:hypothetical protein [Arthrobacter crystallopoietes]EMY35210.1 HipA N-terminal domain-containing protein [Arthrobacter crystallopoietes BAB-32]